MVQLCGFRYSDERIVGLKGKNGEIVRLWDEFRCLEDFSRR